MKPLWILAVTILVTCGSASAGIILDDGTFSVDARSSYLRAAGTDSPFNPTFINLASLPIPVTPGMTIVATTLGDYCPLSPNPGCQQFVEPLGALFSSQGPGSLLPGTNLNRLPGAVMAPGIPGVVDPPTWVWGQTTDIPQDFQLGVASVTGSTLTVPAGALWLVVGVLDSYYADNFDPDHNLAVNITVDPPGNEQILEVHNPEPGTYVMLLTGLAGFVVWRRFQLHRR